MGEHSLHGLRGFGEAGVISVVERVASIGEVTLRWRVRHNAALICERNWNGGGERPITGGWNEMRGIHGTVGLRSDGRLRKGDGGTDGSLRRGSRLLGRNGLAGARSRYEGLSQGIEGEFLSVGVELGF